MSVFNWQQSELSEDTKANLRALSKVLDEMHSKRIDVMHLFEHTDGKEAWYGIAVDKTKYRIVFEDETEDRVYLKLVKIQTGEQ